MAVVVVVVVMVMVVVCIMPVFRFAAMPTRQTTEDYLGDKIRIASTFPIDRRKDAK